MSIHTSPIHDIENQIDSSSYRKLHINTSPVYDIENQLKIVKPIPKKDNKSKNKTKKRVTIKELYNKNKSFYKDAPPKELFSPEKIANNSFIPINTINTSSDTSITNTKKPKASSPLSWKEYKKTHLSPIEWNTSKDDYFPGGYKHKKYTRIHKKNKKHKKYHKTRKNKKI